MFKEHLGWVLNLLSSSLKFTRKKLGFYWKINTFSFLRILVWHVLQSNPPKSKESGLVRPHPLTVPTRSCPDLPGVQLPTGSTQLGLLFHLYAVEPVIILFSLSYTRITCYIITLDSKGFSTAFLFQHPPTMNKS